MKKSFIFVLASSFLLILGTYISGTILTPYAISIGATWFQVGVLSGSMYVIRLLFGTYIGKIADSKGSFTVLKYSLMLYPVITIAYYFASNMTFLIGARLLHGIASAMMIPMGMAYIGEISPKGSEGSYMGIYNLCIIAASGAGPMISTMVASYYGYGAAFSILFILAAVSLIIIQFCKEDKQESETKEKEEIKKINKSSIYLLKNKTLLALGSANFAMAVTSSLIGFFILPYLKNIGIESRYTGSIVAVYYLVCGIFQIYAGKFIDSHSKLRVSLFSGILISISLMCFIINKNVLIVCICIIITALCSVVFQTSINSLSVIEGRQYGMGQTMGFINTANSAGMIFCCIMLGIMPVSADNYCPFFIFSAIANIIFVLGFRLCYRKKNID